MAQVTQYYPNGLPGKVRTFSPKTEAVPEHIGDFTQYGFMGLPVARRTFSPKTEADVISASHMRSMRMGIEYETILEDVTPSDSADLAGIGILYIGTTGDVKVDGVKGGSAITLKNIPSGTWLNFIRVKKVYSTGTTATDIVLAR